ncbi:hypothetical protein KPH14_013147, partial [Odynerus spinipes]
MNDECDTPKKLLKDGREHDFFSNPTYAIEKSERTGHESYVYLVNANSLNDVILRLLRKYENANSASSYANLVYEKINEPWKVDLAKVRTKEEYSESFVTILVRCFDQPKRKRLERIKGDEKFILSIESDEVHVKPKHVYIPVAVNFVPNLQQLLRDKCIT